MKQWCRPGSATPPPDSAVSAISRPVGPALAAPRSLGRAGGSERPTADRENALLRVDRDDPDRLRGHEAPATTLPRGSAAPTRGAEVRECGDLGASLSNGGQEMSAASAREAPRGSRTAASELASPSMWMGSKDAARAGSGRYGATPASQSPAGSRGPSAQWRGQRGAGPVAQAHGAPACPGRSAAGSTVTPPPHASTACPRSAPPAPHTAADADISVYGRSLARWGKHRPVSNGATLATQGEARRVHASPGSNDGRKLLAARIGRDSDRP